MVDKKTAIPLTIHLLYQGAPMCGMKIALPCPGHGAITGPGASKLVNCPKCSEAWVKLTGPGPTREPTAIYGKFAL